MKYCSKCVMPDTRPHTIFQGDTCQACINYENRKNIDWDARFQELRSLCDLYKKDSGYDCVIPVSGGKDSHFLVYMMKEVMGMNPLLVTVGDPFTKTEAGKHNLNNLSATFKCDHIQFNISPSKLIERTREDFENEGIPLKYIEAEIYRIPQLIAKSNDIELVMYAENSDYELGSSDHDIGLSEAGYFYMSYYVPWEWKKNCELAERYGFRSLASEWKRKGAIEDYDQIDSIGYLFHLWMKYPKFGYASATDISSLWVRRGQMTRDKAFKLIRKHDHVLDPKVMNDFMDVCGYTLEQLWDIIEEFWNKDIFQKVKGKWDYQKES